MLVLDSQWKSQINQHIWNYFSHKHLRLEEHLYDAIKNNGTLKSFSVQNTKQYVIPEWKVVFIWFQHLTALTKIQLFTYFQLVFMCNMLYLTFTECYFGILRNTCEKIFLVTDIVLFIFKIFFKRSRVTNYTLF